MAKPTTCIVDPKRGQMFLRWQDGHESLLPLELVRAHCPCVECRQRRVEGEAAPASALPTAVEELGHHALQIAWQDGHQAGLYPWSLLRALCACAACQAAATARPFTDNNAATIE